MLKPIDALKVRHNLGEILIEVANRRQRFLIKRAGIPAAVLLSPVDYEELEALLEVKGEERDEEFQKSLRKARAAIAAGRYATLDDLKADLEVKERGSRRVPSQP